MTYYTKTLKAIYSEFNSSKTGLSAKQIATAREEYGENVIRVRGEPLWKKIIEPFADIFVGILLFAAIVSFWHGAYIDAYIVLAIIAINAIIYYVQRFSTERILRTLQKKNALLVDAIRSGKDQQIDSSELVPGDIIMLSEGVKIPADSRLIEASSFRVDESQMTGESMPIEKRAEQLSGVKEVYERNNMVFQGSFVVGGEAMAIVVTTGNNTEFGQLAALSANRDKISPVQKKINELVQKLVIAIFAISFVTFGLALWRGIELAESLRFVLALAVSAVPEGLPIAITVILVLGMRHMAGKKALVRNMRAIETIGTVTTIATDKTGTLTKNKLTVQDTWQPDYAKNLIETIHKSLNIKSTKSHDPLDVSLEEYMHKKHVSQLKSRPVKSFPFDQTTAMSGNLWHSGENYIAVLKGAPEKILESADITEGEREQAMHQLHAMTAKGYRAIAFATVKLKKSIDSLESLDGHRLEFAGLVAVADILRVEASAAIRTAINAGVSVRMITGDHFETAYHIGKELGMVERRNQVFDSRRMSVMSDKQLELEIESVRVFSRVIPEHKHRLLTILKKRHITAMTGDGVNDVPALSNANVGIAMGSGSQIAKDAGDIILLDDNFKSIVDAIAEGRVIFGNIKRMVSYLLATNMGEVLVAVVALLLGMPLPLAAVQLLWINLVTDSSMVIPLGLEPGDKNNMRRPPNNPRAPLLTKFMITRIVLVAIAMAAITLGFYAYYLTNHSHEYARTVAFCVLVVMQWASAFCARNEHEPIWRILARPNLAFYVGLGVSILLQLIALFTPVSKYLHVIPISLTDLLLTSVSSFMLLIVLVEIHKLYGRKKHQNLD